MYSFLFFDLGRLGLEMSSSLKNASIRIKVDVDIVEYMMLVIRKTSS
jgi:hypothetical protein